MQITETNADGLKREFKVVIPGAAVQEQVESRLKDRRRASGCRASGPARCRWRWLSKQRQNVMGEVLEQTVSDSSPDRAASATCARPASPRSRSPSSSDDSDLEFSVALELSRTSSRWISSR